MEVVNRKAAEHMQRCVALADRRAFYSARSEVLAALRLIAEGLDAQERSSARSESLARGIAALEEAQDFVPRGGAVSIEIPVAELAAAHRTTLLKSSTSTPAENGSVTPLQALQVYYTYAQEQLAAAVRPSAEGSYALSALGKLYAEMDKEPSRLTADGRTRALVCQQAALLADSRNARAANELGVLLAREGRYEEARDWLRHSVQTAALAEGWHNLSVVYDRLREPRLAEAARRESQSLARREGSGKVAPAGGAIQVRQVGPAEFAAAGRDVGLNPPPPAAVTAKSQPAQSGTPQAGSNPGRTNPGSAKSARGIGEGLWDWWPWK